MNFTTFMTCGLVFRQELMCLLRPVTLSAHFKEFLEFNDSLTPWSTSGVYPFAYSCVSENV
jgi:hypothetical protein